MAPSGRPASERGPEVDGADLGDSGPAAERLLFLVAVGRECGVAAAVAAEVGAGDAAEKSLLYAYIVLSLLTAYAPRKRGSCAGTTWSWTGSGTGECRRRGPWQRSVLS